MTTVIMIPKKGKPFQAELSFAELVNTPHGAIIKHRAGFGFQAERDFKKVSDYTFEEV